MQKIFLFLILLPSIFLGGCQTCLTFTGAYKEYSGSVKWCPDHEETAKTGQAIVQNEYGEKSVILSPEEIIVVNEVLSAKIEPVKTQTANAEKLPPHLELIRLVNKLDRPK